MLVRFSILADASGSAGGVTAARGRSGQLLRARTVPTDPSSPSQSLVRAIFSSLASSWHLRTRAQRNGWSDFAANVPVTNRLGDTRFLTGYQVYIRNNAARIQAGLTRVDNPPTIFAAATLSSVSLLPVAATNLLEVSVTTLDPWTAQSGAALLIYATRQSPRTVRYRKNPYRFAAAILGPFDPPIPQTFLVPAPFTLTLPFGNSIFTRFAAVTADGRLSPIDARGPTLIQPA